MGRCVLLYVQCTICVLKTATETSRGKAHVSIHNAAARPVAKEATYCTTYTLDDADGPLETRQQATTVRRYHETEAHHTSRKRYAS